VRTLHGIRKSLQQLADGLDAADLAEEKWVIGEMLDRASFPGGTGTGTMRDRLERAFTERYAELQALNSAAFTATRDDWPDVDPDTLPSEYQHSTAEIERTIGHIRAKQAAAAKEKAAEAVLVPESVAAN